MTPAQLFAARRLPAVRRAFVRLARLATAALFLLGVHGCRPADTLRHDTTDVLLLTLCTLRADHLGAYGYPADISPTIDDLADRGVLFERTLTGAPWTRPAIASMITGLYPRSLGIEEREEIFNNRALLDQFLTLAEQMRAAGYATRGVTANPNNNAVYNFDQGYDFYQDTGRLWAQGYDKHKVDADKVIETLLAQLRDRPRSERVFAHLVFVDVHGPFPEGKAEAETGIRFDGKSGSYATQVRYLDTMLGRLLTAYRDLGRDNLLVVINSDHGEGFGEAPHIGDVGHGFHLYNSTIWVPLIVHHPALTTARRIAETVEMVDLAPTLLELLEIPFDPASFDGRSLAATIRDGGRVPDHPTGVTETGYGPVARSTLLTDDWKLVVTDQAPDLPTGRGPAMELYRYRQDPTEAENLAAAERATTERMYRSLTTWQHDRDARTPTETEPVEVSGDAAEALRNLGYLVDDGHEKEGP